MKAGGAGTASWGKGRDEIRDHTDQESHRERSASFGPSRRSQRCFREEEGLSLPGVLTGSFCRDGDTTAWSGVGPAWGHSAGTL